MSEKQSIPVVVKKQQWKFLFGYVKIQYIVEDRRPDLVGEYHYAAKYKHYITALIGWKRFNWTLHTKHPYDDLPNIANKVK